MPVTGFSFWKPPPDRQHWGGVATRPGHSGMKLLTLILFPLGVLFIAYGISIQIANNPPRRQIPPSKWAERFAANYNHPDHTETRP